MGDHDLPINDIRHAWTEMRRGWRTVDTYGPDGPGVIYEVGDAFEVFCGKCTCGWRTEGRTSDDVVRDWMRHRETIGEEGI